jgi:hypothetical protein
MDRFTYISAQKIDASDSKALNILFLILPNTDHLHQVEDNIRGCT